MSLQERIESKIKTALMPSHLEIINESHKHNVQPSLESHFTLVIVYSVADTGVNKDAGRTRFTFGYRTRAWTVVAEADYRLVESIAPAAKAPLANVDHLWSISSGPRHDRYSL